MIFRLPENDSDNSLGEYLKNMLWIHDIDE